ncbi:MAG: MFS transporter [Planctomycetota bacterium]
MVQPKGFLARLGIDRREARAWAWYDWANSAFYTVVVTAVFPQFLAKVLAVELPEGEAARLYALTNAISLAFVALGALLLGAVADANGWRRRLLSLFACLGILATAGLFFLGPGDIVPGLVLYAIANFGVAMSVVFYDALLPHVARSGEEDQLSSTGFAFGYVGGGLLLAAAVGLALGAPHFGLTPVAEDPSMLALRIGFLFVAVWWALFSLPVLLLVPEPPSVAGTMGFRDAIQQVRSVWGELRQYPQALMMLIAFLLYSDGINTIIRMSSIYAEELGIPLESTLMVFLAIQFVGVPATLLLAKLATRIGAKRVVMGGVVAFVGITAFGFQLSSELDFWMLGLSVGCVMGGVQALSRSLFARMIPRQKSGEFFGLFALGEKVGGALGPGLFFLAADVFDSSRMAILVIAVFFLAGGFLLSKVDVAVGERHATEAEARIPTD